MSLPPNLKKLDISLNPSLTNKSYQSLIAKLIEMKTKLTHLSLDGNEVGDFVCMDICGMIETMATLQVINLSKCNITDIGSLHVSGLIENANLKIRSLILHWN